MKKYLYIAIAAATLASCSQDEVMDVAETEAIAFGGGYVEKSTRAVDNVSKTNSTLESFILHGTVTNKVGDSDVTVKLYDGEEVKGKVGNETWTGYSKQYWIEGASYKFAAIVDGTVATTANNMPATLSYELSSQKDMLYDEEIRNNVGSSDYGTVQFTFSHLLSKIFFNFRLNAASGNESYTYKVTDVKITSGLATKGTYTCAEDGTWSITGSPTTGSLEFGAIDGASDNGTAVALTTSNQDSQYARLIIPGQQTLAVQYTLHTYFGNTEIDRDTKTASVTHTFVKNHVYGINASVAPLSNEINFTVSSFTDWTNGGTVDVQQ